MGKECDIKNFCNVPIIYMSYRQVKKVQEFRKIYSWSLHDAAGEQRDISLQTL
jgi:hypothetical protein